MQPRVDLITLGVPDVGAARSFYVDGLGWPAIFEVPGDIVFVQIGHGLVLGLFGRANLDADAAEPAAPEPAATEPAATEPIDPGGARDPGAPPMSLAHIVETEEEVFEVLALAEAAGARILKRPQRADFGGFHGYFADPAGFRWEVATNPGWHVGPDGTVVIGPVGG